MTGVELSLDKEYYVPGETLSGVVRLRLDKQTKIRGIYLHTSGVETTAVTVHRGKQTMTYHDYNHIIDYKGTLAGPGEIPAGAYDYRFNAAIPPNALPTYTGRNVTILYAVNVDVDIPFWLDAKQKREFPVFLDRRTIRMDTVPMRFGSPDAMNPSAPGFIVDLRKGQFFAGEFVQGTLALTGTGNKRIRKANIGLVNSETASAAGHSTGSDSRTCFAEVPLDVAPGVPIPFSLQVPQDVPSTYYGMYSSLRWLLNINLDIAFGFDVAASQELVILNCA